MKENQIPPEAEEAAARAMCRNAYKKLPSFNWEDSMRDDADGPYWRECARVAMAAGITVWPGAYTANQVQAERPAVLCLPLVTEACSD
jgi:hypothetical protein